MIFLQVIADIIPDCSEERGLQAMRALEERWTRTVTLRDFLLLFLAHLVWIVVLLEKFVGIFDPVDAEIQVFDVLVAGPQSRRFVRRVRTIRREGKVRLIDRDGCGLLRFGLPCGLCSARADDVEAQHRSDERNINNCDRKIPTDSSS